MKSGKTKSKLVVLCRSNTETARVCTRVPAAAAVSADREAEQTDCKFGGSFSLDLIDPPLHSENQVRMHHRRTRKVSDWSSVQSEQSAGDASSTRDCSTTECGEEQQIVGVPGVMPATEQSISSSLKGRRGVLCLGASKIESIKRETQQKKAAFEEEASLNFVPHQSKQSHQVAIKRLVKHRSTPLPNNKRLKEESRGAGAQPFINNSVKQHHTQLNSFAFAGFAGPRFKSSPSPTSVPIPVFDSSD
eukprot:Protomagalhaensia_sp_Gyna_25__747@NODE_1358_length_1911_cov_20_689103_g1090_i0_p1_GENE_NODE_1358_length_1911_cov_20_689103_g1090_i0NODE_1358_length_1911_cov_20_689103_g1090_i0_p1_ORF_typecomplete_len247_score24_11PNRC/PF15365_6/0_0087_NODE_1358_length_1911_cov_20_689103_g1090_i09551695